MSNDTYTQVTRTMVNKMGEELKEVKTDFKEFMVKMDKRFDKLEDNIKCQLDDIKEKQTDLFNHQSSRIPPELAKKLNRLYGILGSIVGGAVIAIITVLL